MEPKTFKIEEQPNIRLDSFLASQLKDYSRTHLKNLINSGNVLVNNKNVKPHYTLRKDDEVSISFPDKVESSLLGEDIPLDIIYEDKDVIVLNKPAGLVVHPGAGNDKSTLVNALLNHTKDLSDINPERPGIVHRLDMETSGVMVVAKNNFTHLELAKQFKDHSIKRRYIALVKGLIDFKEGIVDVPIDRHPVNRQKMLVRFSPEARTAETYYRVIKKFDDFTLVELLPKTGRTHQLRVHMAHLKHPIMGDSKYGNKHNFSRLALHAKDLGFFHPGKEKFVEFSSELPKEMKATIGNIKV